jgi:UDP-glucose:glycoprotein glucosyltransferase
MSTLFYDLPTTTKRRSRYLIPGVTEDKLRVFNLQKLFEGDASKKLAHDFIYNRKTSLGPLELSLTLAANESRGAPVSTWIVGDLDSAEGREIIDLAMRHLLVSRKAEQS